MKVIDVRNVQDALPLGLYRMKTEGLPRDSRNGPVLLFDGPTATVYRKPRERVMFHEKRDCNPFFHLFESLWMLAGRNDVAFVTKFVSTMSQFSDDGVTFHGAYGHRWREHFEFDQIDVAIKILKENKDDRRCVVQMWDANTDMGQQGKDFPCNTQVVFSINGKDELDMSVFNRSNDMIWGAYGANAVHFSYLQEYIASAIGVEVGRYWQISNNFHAYRKTYDPIEFMADKGAWPHLLAQDNPYTQGTVEPFPLMSVTKETWDSELKMFLESGPTIGITDPFFRRVAGPIWQAWDIYKDKNLGMNRYVRAITHIQDKCQASDWRKACVEWLERRQEKEQYRIDKLESDRRFDRAQDDGVSYE